MLRTIIQNIERVIKLVSQTEVAGGLVLSDSSFKYTKFSAGKPKQFVLRLPPGLVEDGRIKDRLKVIAALYQMKNMIEPTNRKKIAVVISLENSLVYSQIFNLPHLEGAALKEAAELNLQIISPLNINQSYYGYEVIDQSIIDGRQLEVFGAFILAEVVDEWIRVLTETDFTVAAVEFQAFGLVRELINLAQPDPKRPHAVLAVSSEGVDFIVIKNNHLYFDYFYSWKSIQADNRQIAWSDFIKMIIGELEKILRFSASRFGVDIDSAYLITQGLSEEIKQALVSAFPKIKIEEPIINNQRLSPGWLESLGAARRGLMPRSRDNYISLSAISVLEKYYQNQALGMLVFWRNIFVVAISFFILIFGISNIFLRHIQVDLQTKPVVVLSESEEAEFAEIKERAKEFNRLVLLIGEARQSESSLSAFLSEISVKSDENNITLTKVTIQSIEKIVILNGASVSQEAVIRFKNDIELMPQINEVNLPLASLILTQEGLFSFSMSLKIKSLDF